MVHTDNPYGVGKPSLVAPGLLQKEAAAYLANPQHSSELIKKSKTKKRKGRQRQSKGG